MRSLILAGGVSSRMGTSKYTLPLPTASSKLTQPLLLHLILCHHQLQLSTGSAPLSEVIISVRDELQKAEIERLLTSCRLPDDLHLSYAVDELANAGPASGLLAAYHLDQHASWLVTGCDYPLVTSAALRQLWATSQSEHASITCFVNDEGFCEPMLAVWSSRALQLLHQMMASAQLDSRKLGPNQVIRTLEKMPPLQCDSRMSEAKPNVFRLQPKNLLLIRNVNTPQEWTAIQPYLKVRD